MQIVYKNLINTKSGFVYFFTTTLVTIQIIQLIHRWWRRRHYQPVNCHKTKMLPLQAFSLWDDVDSLNGDKAETLTLPVIMFIINLTLWCVSRISVNQSDIQTKQSLKVSLTKATTSNILHSFDSYLMGWLAGWMDGWTNSWDISECMLKIHS